MRLIRGFAISSLLLILTACQTTNFSAKIPVELETLCRALEPGDGVGRFSPAFNDAIAEAANTKDKRILKWNRAERRKLGCAI